jgi:hypothetical protein
MHPRLYLDATRIAQLRQAIQTTHAPMWKELRQWADRAVKRGAPGYRERDISSGDEQLWQRDVGNAMPVLATAWVLSGDRQYLGAAREWALASCGYRTWGLGRIDGMDLAAGHQLYGLGLVYDWLKFMDLARSRLGVDLYTGQWWRNTARYAQCLALPRQAWTRDNSIVSIADCPRSHWYGPDYLLCALAREFRDGYAQWLAQQVEDAGVAAPQAPWLNLLWFDPGQPAAPPSSLPTLRHFEDMGIVSARSGWSGDESLVVFKCGPFLGHKAVQEFTYDPGGGHVHPDANHFVLFGAGDWLVRDDGYMTAHK